MKKAFVKTYGCQMNEQDSAQMQALLARAGFASAADEFDADLILINTCSIREKVVNKVYSDLGRVREIKETKPELMVGIAGCVSETDKEKLAKRFPFLDLVFGPDHIRRIPELISDIDAKRLSKAGKRDDKNWVGNTLVQTGFDLRRDFKFVNVLPHEEESTAKAFVTIQKGCDNICSFCIVPFVRGREVSRPAQEIIDEVKALVDRGVKEITLLGQNVNSYGLKNTGDATFTQLIKRLSSETAIRRIRFTSSHPKDVGPDLVEEFGVNSKLCPLFHLPVQSGSDAVLAAMRRQYTRGSYLRLVEDLKKARPDVRFSTDLIVGFPTETKADFEQTLSLMRDVAFDFCYTFMYSPRPYTQAAKLIDDVAENEKLARLEKLQQLERELALDANKLCENTIQEVLVENCDSEANPSCMGRTASNKIVHFSAKVLPQPGDFVNVRVMHANTRSLMGEMCE